MKKQMHYLEETLYIQGHSANDSSRPKPQRLIAGDCNRLKGKISASPIVLFPKIYSNNRKLGYLKYILDD